MREINLNGIWRSTDGTRSIRFVDDDQYQYSENDHHYNGTYTKTDEAATNTIALHFTDVPNNLGIWAIMDNDDIVLSPSDSTKRIRFIRPAAQ